MCKTQLFNAPFIYRYGDSASQLYLIKIKNLNINCSCPQCQVSIPVSPKRVHMIWQQNENQCILKVHYCKYWNSSRRKWCAQTHQQFTGSTLTHGKLSSMVSHTACRVVGRLYVHRPKNMHTAWIYHVPLGSTARSVIGWVVVSVQYAGVQRICTDVKLLWIDERHHYSVMPSQHRDHFFVEIKFHPLLLYFGGAMHLQTDMFFSDQKYNTNIKFVLLGGKDTWSTTASFHHWLQTTQQGNLQGDLSPVVI